MLAPATFVMAAHAAMPIGRIAVGPRQELARLRRLDDGDGSVRPQLCALGVEGHKKMEMLASIGIERGEQRRVGHIEIGLVERYLCGVARKVFSSPSRSSARQFLALIALASQMNE